MIKSRDSVLKNCGIDISLHLLLNFAKKVYCRFTKWEAASKLLRIMQAIFLFRGQMVNDLRICVITALVCFFTDEKVPMIVFIVLALFFGIVGVVLIIRAVRTFVRGRYNISFSGQQIVVKQGKKEKQYLCSDIKEISADSLNKKNKGYIKCIFKDDNKIIFKKSDKDFQQVMEYFLTLIEIEGDEKYAVSLHSLTQLQSHASKE